MSNNPILKCDVQLGSSLFECLKEASCLAKQLNVWVEFNGNGRNWIVTPTTDPEWLYTQKP